MADIFVSYTSSDRDWAFWIAKELEALGHIPHIHEWEIRGGDDIYAWMEQRHDAADHVLCLISDAYLKAPYSTLERKAAQWQAAGQRPGFVLFVAVKPCKLPTLADHIRRCEIFGVPEDAARVRFREFMQKREAPAAAVFPGKVFAVSNVPIRVPQHFLGREDSLAAIEIALSRYEGRVAITALHGLRGVGKTTLAAAYAERHRGDYRATWWIRARTRDGTRADLVALGVRLNWVGADEKEEPALAVVMERLRHEGEGILLIYDDAIDANDLKRYLPRGGAARVLVTSNAPAWRGVASPVEIRLWPTEIGADYFVARTGREAERDAATALSEALGGLPLAHEQAAAYCERLDIALAEYGKRFEKAPARFLDDSRHAAAEYHDGLTVAKTFELAIKEAANLHPAAEPLIIHAALLAPEPIPLFFFAEGRGKLGEPLASAFADEGLDEAIAALRAFALIDRETIPDERDADITTDTIRLHRLVRQVAATRREGDAREEVRRALLGAMVAVYPQNVYNTPKVWPRARRLDPLALALIDSGSLPSEAEAFACPLVTGLACYRHSALAAYLQARPLYERALAICERSVGPEHPDVATGLNNLANLLRDQGDLAGARRLHERALRIREHALAPDDAVTATSLYNLAILVGAQGEFAQSRALLERALSIREKALGPDHVETALILNELAIGLQNQGDHGGAEPFLERALAIHEKALGQDHPDTVTCLGNLAFARQAMGLFAQARPLQERALAIREKVQGPEHPQTATALTNLARLLASIGESIQAEPMFLRAIAIGDKVLGKEHPIAQRYRSNYARMLLDAGRPAQALDYAEPALALHAAKNGPDHPWTKDDAQIAAGALAALGRAPEAAALRDQYAIREQTT